MKVESDFKASCDRGHTCFMSLQAYKLDQQTQEERFSTRLTAELVRKELDVIQLSSLVKAERQNMDNDYSTHGRTIQGLQERLYVINAEKHTLLKVRRFVWECVCGRVYMGGCMH